ncbi:MAG TPA: hypothetical protein ENJ38_00125 [Rhodospirillales bacterium]|nr:hypothetical protein [Rhodospirillales bacterium]
MWEMTGGRAYCEGCRSIRAPCATVRPHECRRFTTIPETEAGRKVAALLTRSLFRGEGGVPVVDVPGYIAACRASGLTEGDALWFVPWIDAALSEIADGRRDP